MTIHGPAHIGGGIVAPMNVFSTRLIMPVALRILLGSVRGSSLVQNMVAAATLGALSGVCQVCRPPLLTTETHTSHLCSTNSFFTSLPLGVQQRLMPLTPDPLHPPQTPAPSRKQPHHVPCLGASDPSTTESVRGRVQKGKRAGMRKRACDGGKCTGGHTKMREGDCKNMSKIGCEVSGLLTIGKAWPFRIGLWKW